MSEQLSTISYFLVSAGSVIAIAIVGAISVEAIFYIS